VETGKINMKTIKVIEGKVFMCEEIAVNSNAQRPERIPSYNLKVCMDAVSLRMKHCLDQLEQSVQSQSVYAVDVPGIHHANGIFVISSYKAMETLLTKLEENAETATAVDATWFEENLTFLEADQLFKAFVATSNHFSDREMRLLDVVVSIRKRCVGDPAKTVLRTHPKPE
jgi:hypothetical protein